MAFTRSPIFRIVVVLTILAVPVSSFAADAVGKAIGSGAAIDWQVSSSNYDSIELTIMGPDGEGMMRKFPAGKTPSFRVQDLGGSAVDGVYTYQLRVTPKVSADLKKKLESARKSGDEAAARKLIRESGLSAPEQSGAFTIRNGAIVATDLVESGNQATGGAREISSEAVKPRLTPVVEDQVIPDDLIVQGSGCFGFDCVNNESFGFDTIRLKENNLRIKAEDTSVGTFPTNDWQLTFNDSASGGASKFSVEDITGSKVPMTITAGASTNSIFVDSTGRVGFRTSTPVLDLHVTTGNTPAIRLEQTNASGFTAQTWDIGANEANFFVRDVTSGSRLPFRIRPGAPTSSLDISADGFVGIGTASPDRLVHLNNSGGNATMQFTNNVPKSWHFGNATNDLNFSETGVADARLYLQAGGNVGINCSTPGSDLVIASGGGCNNPASNINAGATQFTVTSSRTFKENLQPVAVPGLLDKMGKVAVYNYDFINGPTDRLGMVAEEFHEIFGRGSEKLIDGNEVQLALWLAVQQLTEQNKALTERVNALDNELASQQK